MLERFLDDATLVDSCMPNYDSAGRRKLPLRRGFQPAVRIPALGMQTTVVVRRNDKVSKEYGCSIDLDERSARLHLACRAK
jgi:hypothetical protein